MKIKIGLVDDHQLFLKLLSVLVSNLNGFSVVVEAGNGKELQEKIESGSPLPDIMLIDVNMPVMNGFQTAKWLHASYPSIRMVALSMNDTELTVFEMLNAGCCSYLLKNTHPDLMEKVLTEIYLKNYYDSYINNTNLSELVLHNPLPSTTKIGEKEREFLQHATSDLTYKEIAGIMDLSQRTIDGYRESLFTKLKVQSRTGMILEAIKRGLVRV
jgi:DNA-binding NarL/FixJ family response regulator